MNNLLSNTLGISLNVPAFFLNVKGLVFGPEAINLYLTIFISVLAIVWSVMKIYHQYLQTKKLKEGIKHGEE